MSTSSNTGKMSQASSRPDAVTNKKSGHPTGKAPGPAKLTQELNAIIGKRKEDGGGKGGVSHRTDGGGKSRTDIKGEGKDKGLSRSTSASNVSKTIEEACRAAALEDGLIHPGESSSSGKPVGGPDPKTGSASSNSNTNNNKPKNGLRRGKWTAEEESYANRLIQEFKSGLLPLADGTTLRTFLSKLLNCDPMRISKKFVGQNCIGKQVFRRRQADMDRLTAEDIERSRSELAELELKFLERVAQTNRCKNSGGVGSKHGSGQVAPDIVRRQEYAGLSGQGLGHGGMVAPWMLPSANGQNPNNPYNNPPPPGLLNWDTQKPPQHRNNLPAKGQPPAKGRGAGTSGQSSQAGLRRGATSASSAPPVPPMSSSMSRSNSQESLTGLMRSISSETLSEFPRNSSLQDLASIGLGLFNLSPYPSTDNLTNLVNNCNQSSSMYGSGMLGDTYTDNFASGPSPNSHPSSSSSNSFFNGPGGEDAVLSRPSSFSRPESSGRLNRMPRVDSATGLSSLRMAEGAMPRNTSVEDFLSLVAYGDISAPDHDVLNKSLSLFSQQHHLAAQAAERGARGAGGGAGSFQPAVFSGLGKASGLAGPSPYLPPSASSSSQDASGRKRGRAPLPPSEEKLKQPKMELKQSRT